MCDQRGDEKRETIVFLFRLELLNRGWEEIDGIMLLNQVERNLAVNLTNKKTVV